METVREEEGPGLSHSDEEEDGDLSSDEGAIIPERETVVERVEPEDDASTGDHGLDATARGSDADDSGQGERAITRLSCRNEPLEENGRSSTGSGAPSVVRSVSVETGPRNLKVSEGDAPEKGERTLFMSFVNTRASRPGFNVVDDYSDAITPYFVNSQDVVSIPVAKWRGQIWKVTKTRAMTVPMTKKAPSDMLRLRGSRKELRPRSPKTRTGNGSTIRESLPSVARGAGSRAARRRTASSSRWLVRDGSRRGSGPVFAVSGCHWTHLEASGEARVVVEGNNLAIRPLGPGKMAVPCPGSTRRNARSNTSRLRPPPSLSHDHGIRDSIFG